MAASALYAELVWLCNWRCEGKGSTVTHLTWSAQAGRFQTCLSADTSTGA